MQEWICRYNIRYSVTDANNLVATPVDVPILVYEIGVVEGQVGAACADISCMVEGVSGGQSFNLDMSWKAALCCLATPSARIVHTTACLTV